MPSFVVRWQSAGLEPLPRTLAFQPLLLNICTGQFNYEP